MKTFPMNDAWKFSPVFTHEMVKPDYQDHPWESIRIPHTNQMLPYNYIDERSYAFVSCYRKTFFVPEEWEGQSVLVRFDGAAHIANIYLNGEEVFYHECGYTAFTVDLTDGLRYGQDNILAVRLDSTENPKIPPFGHVVDYLTYGGIYREVTLLVGNRIHLSDGWISTESIDQNGVRAFLQATVSDGTAWSYTIDASLIDDEGETVWNQTYSCQRNGLRVSEDLGHLHLWSLEDPYLYHLKLTLRREEEILDTLTVRTGFRTAEFHNDGFYLNGVPIKLAGLNRHQSYPYIGYAAPKSLQVMDADLIRDELGLNAVRTSHYPQSHHFLDRCDERGILVLTEIPGWQHIGDSAWKETALQNTEEMVVQFRRHPSIILWGVRINESPDDDAFYTRTNAIAKRLDPTRQTGGVRNLINSRLHEDVYTYNDFNCNGERPPLKRKTYVTGTENVPYLVTENNGHMFPTKTFDHEDKRLEQAYRHAQVQNAMYETEGIAGAFGWCMFDYNTHKDFGSGDRICYHGVMDMFRNRKLAGYLYASQGERPVFELSSTMDIGEHPGGVFSRIMAFTNADVIHLYKNGVFIRDFYPDRKEWKGLPHPPVRIDDFVGNQLVENEHMSVRDSDEFKDIMQQIGKLGPNGIPMTTKLALNVLLAKYNWTMAEANAKFQKYVANWGADVTTYRFVAEKDGAVIADVLHGPATEVKLSLSCDHQILHEEETYDMAAIRIRAVDQNGHVVPFFSEAVCFQTEGPIELAGPAYSALPGGMGGCYVRTTGKIGPARLTVTSPARGSETIEFSVV